VKKILTYAVMLDLS